MRCSKAIATLLATTLLAAAVLLTACGQSGPTWVDSSADYTTQSLSSLYAKADISKYADAPAANTATARHDALVALRRDGTDAANAADLLTKTLPSDSRGIPVYVERAKINGRPALIMIEAIGPAKGKLTTKRLWALSDQGSVIFVGTR